MFDARQFGATGDGTTLDTGALQAALDACAAAGGGEVYLPAGRYLTGTLRLPGHTVLNISPGATLLGSPNIADYPQIEAYRSGDRTGRHLLLALDVANITITGGGTIDGQGPAFWDTPENPVNDSFPRRPGHTGWRGFHLALSPHDERPSPMVELSQCRDVRVENITLANPAGWTLHLFACQRAWVNGIRINNPMIGPNTDGIDITSSKDVMIANCHIVNGDDSIVLFSNPKFGACERVTVTNCILSSRTCGFKIHGWMGSEFRQVTVNNLVVYNSERAAAFYLHGGGVIEDLLCSNLTVTTGTTLPNLHERPLHIDIRGLDPKDESMGKSSANLGKLRAVTFSNMILRSPGRIILATEAGSPMEDVVLKDIQLFVSGPQDLPSWVNPSPSMNQHNRTLPHIRTAPAHIIVHGARRLKMADIEVIHASPDPLQGMHGMWLEHAVDATVRDFQCYPLQSGYDLIHRI